MRFFISAVNYFPSSGSLYIHFLQDPVLSPHHFNGGKNRYLISIFPSSVMAHLKKISNHTARPDYLFTHRLNSFVHSNNLSQQKFDCVFDSNIINIWRIILTDYCIDPYYRVSLNMLGWLNNPSMNCSLKQLVKFWKQNSPYYNS